MTSGKGEEKSRHLSPFLLSFLGKPLCIISSLPSCIALPGGVALSEEPDDNIKFSKDLPDSFLLSVDAHVPLRSLSNAEEEADRLSSELLHPSVTILVNRAPVTPDTKSLSDIVSLIASASTGKGASKSAPLQVTLLSAPHSGSNVVAPAFRTSRESISSLRRIRVRALAYVRPTASAEDVRQALHEAIRRALLASASAIKDGGGSRCILRHFRVFQGDIALTLAASRKDDEIDEDEASSMSYREELHKALQLDLSRPIFRKCLEMGGSLDAWNGGCEGRLRNVHNGIKSHGLFSGKQSDPNVVERCVQGSYLYCHYRQNNAKDSGWGCAYRSLQTLLSWAVLNGHVKNFENGQLPGHREIQSTLVKIGDKPISLVGSTEWIGANEVCYAIEELCGIQSRIVHVNSGKEMKSIARTIEKHFEEQGSPIMIGGGVLAWTILGVARHEKTGIVKYLILDPHYEGSDDIDIIQNKAWIAWKGVEVFKTDAFYNLCLPIRPRRI